MRVQVVSFHCVLKNKLGHFISSSFNQDVSTSPPPSDSEALPGFIRALKKLKVGKKKKISVPAEEAYGFYDLGLVANVSRTKFSEGARLREGDFVRASLSEKIGEKMYRVTEAKKNSLTLDANHPLAGQDLVFEVELTSSREEIESDEEVSVEVLSENRLLC